MNQKQQNIPELRFTQFNGEWNKTSLGDIAKFSKGKGISKSDISEDGGFECIRYGELYTEYNEIIEEIVSKTNLDKKGLIFSEYNDVIIPSSGETQLDIATASCVLKSDVALGGDLNIIKTRNNGVFLAFYLNNKKKKDIARFAQGNSVVHLYSKQLALLKINLPTLPEQQKIASFLTSVDKRIQALEQKKDLLKQYKKGVMQKIFSREIRFQPGIVSNHLPLAAEPTSGYGGNNSYPDWEVKKLGDIGSTYNGLTGKTKEDFGYGEPYIQYKQIFDNSKIDITKVDYVNITEKDKQNRAKFGDVFFTTSSETPYEIGTASVLLEDLEEIYLNSFCFGFRPKSLQALDPHFSRYLFRSETFRKKIIKLAQGSTRYNMSKVQLLKLKVELPTLEEQQKIAGFLSAIDTKIEAVTSQIDHSKTFKKGLLQKMFV